MYLYKHIIIQLCDIRLPRAFYCYIPSENYYLVKERPQMSTFDHYILAQS